MATVLPRLRIAQGEIQGRRQGAVRAFLGLPYAAPPVGPLLFAAPQPPVSWTGVRRADRPTATAPQPDFSVPRLDMTAVAAAGWVRGDDYLALNVWTPDEAKALPVMVYIHGGGGAVGSKDIAVFDGGGFARSGVICVTINYRLGVQGYLPVPGAPTNLAMRDMIAALKWVKANIPSFGGDPGNVTVFGESGGAMNVSALVASPLAEGLFRRAIIQSGHGSSVYALSAARRIVDRIAAVLKVTADVEGLGSVDAETLLKAQTKVTGLGGIDMRDETGFDPGLGLGRFNVVYGDDVMPLPPLQALAAGAGRSVEVLIGATAEEANLWFIPSHLQWLLPGFAAKWMLGKIMPRATEALRAYGLGRPGQRGGTVLNRTLTDLAFRWPVRQFAQAHQGRTHVYEFEWRSPACRGKLGACHGLDLPFVFDNLAVATGPRGAAGRNPPQELATRVHRLWAGFATNGHLPWAEFDATRQHVYCLHAGQVVQAPSLPIAAFMHL